MANSLNREIKEGERVVVSASIFETPNLPVEDRTFICESGYGMKPYTMGTKIMGRWKKEGTNAAIPAQWIDCTETDLLQASEAQRT